MQLFGAAYCFFIPVFYKHVCTRKHARVGCIVYSSILRLILKLLQHMLCFSDCTISISESLLMHMLIDLWLTDTFEVPGLGALLVLKIRNFKFPWCIWTRVFSWVHKPTILWLCFEVAVFLPFFFCKNQHASNLFLSTWLQHKPQGLHTDQGNLSLFPETRIRCSYIFQWLVVKGIISCKRMWCVLAR